MTIRQKISELEGFVNWNYLGLAAGILSVIVTLYNVNRYYEEIKKQKQVE